MMMPRSAARRAANAVDFQGPGAHLLGQFGADAVDDDIEADIFIVVACRRLGAGREDGFRQLLGLAQAGGQSDAADGAGGLVILPARADDVAAGDGFDRQRLELLRPPPSAWRTGPVQRRPAGPMPRIRRSDGSGTDARSWRTRNWKSGTAFRPCRESGRAAPRRRLTGGRTPPSAAGCRAVHRHHGPCRDAAGAGLNRMLCRVVATGKP